MYKTIQNIKGRIGNQLFEIANGYSYSKRHNRKLLLYLPQERDTYYKKYEWITSMFDTTNNIDNCAVYHEAGNGSYNKIDNINSDIFLDGYFQDERYFKDYKNEIKQLFANPTNIKTDILHKYNNIENCVGIHIRRGDYLLPQNKKIFYIPEISWYEDMYNKYFNGHTAIIFSDDINWCKNNINIRNAVFSDFNNEQYDFYALSLCKNHICSNSTFAWWSCYFGNENAINIFPKYWFTKESKLINKLMLKKWITE